MHLLYRRQGTLANNKKDILYPSSPTVVQDIKDYDITLLSYLITNFLVRNLDSDEKNAVEKIKEMRNKYYAHANEAKMTDSTFFKEWNKLKTVIYSVIQNFPEEKRKSLDEMIDNISKEQLDIKVVIDEIKKLDQTKDFFEFIKKSFDDLNQNIDARFSKIEKDILEIKLKMENQGKNTEVVNTTGCETEMKEVTVINDEDVVNCLVVEEVCIVQGNQPCGHGHTVCTTVSQAEVNHAIVDLNLHYNNDMCLELLLIDCAKHVTQGDEVVCASNGKTYDNHCRFIHARCEYYLIGHATELTKVHSGPCQTTTAAAIVSTTMAAVNGSTAVTSGTMASGNTTGSGTTMPPAGSASTTMAAITGSMAATASTMGAVNGMTADTTTTMAASASTGTTTVQVTSVLPTGSTTPSVNNMIQQLFCKNVDSVQCGQDFSIVCGTDGQFYPNSCELSKAKCKDVTLTVEPDSSRCITP